MPTASLPEKLRLGARLLDADVHGRDVAQPHHAAVAVRDDDVARTPRRSSTRPPRRIVRSSFDAEQAADRRREVLRRERADDFADADVGRHERVGPHVDRHLARVGAGDRRLRRRPRIARSRRVMPGIGQERQLRRPTSSPTRAPPRRSGSPSG